jgi:hypothetical protein
VQIETSWRNPKEQRPGALQKNQYRELDLPDNPDAEPPCDSTKTAIVVFGKHVGRTLTVCTDNDCSVHNPHIAAQRAADPPPTIAPAPEAETEEEAEARQAEYEQRSKEYEADQQRKEEERKQESERQQKEYEADEKLTEFALRLVLTGHMDIPRESDFDFLTHVEAAFVAPPPNKARTGKKSQPVKAVVKPKAKTDTPPKKEVATKKAA